jgi:hypothetical protein
MAIGDIFQSIIDGIRSFISWFFSVAPKPLLYFFFLMFLILMGNFLIPLISNAFGYHCDGSGTVWKTETFDFISNLDLLRHKPDLENEIYRDLPFMCDIRPQFMVKCTNCSYNGTGLFESQYCVTTGYPLAEYTSFTKKLICNTYGCKPPKGYVYNYTIDKFQCVEDFCVNETLNDYNQKIYKIEGAVPVYYDSYGNFSAQNVIYFKCKANNPTNIRLTFFGLDIFDYRIWLMFILIGMVFWGYKNISK